MKKYSSCLLVSAFIIVSIAGIISSTPAVSNNKSALHMEQPPAKASAVLVRRPSGKGLQTVSRDPYLGALVVDASTGKVLFNDNGDVKGYPASLVKLMNLLIILEAVEAEQISLKDKVAVSAEVAGMGGSQVYLKEKEVYTVDDLLYALMIQSANDAALALALHYKGSRDEFVSLMNRRAGELGMKDTVFHSVHGLPPGKGQLPDVSTPHDITRLCRELLRHPRALRYTSTRKRLFRIHAPEPFVMLNHNHLVGRVKGCDGFKTGYFRAAGFSIAATAASEAGRVIAVVFGSVSSSVRDAKARALLTESLVQIAASPSSRSASFRNNVPRRTGSSSS